MKYMGSKNRIAKHILPIMLEHRGDRPWVEPFVGGGNMIDKVEGQRIGYDLDIDVINALILIRDDVGSIPKSNTEFTEGDFNKKEGWNKSIKSFASFAYSFSGIKGSGWARCSANRDYVAEAYRNACKQSLKLQGCGLHQSSCFDLKFSESCLIYCDPPYAGTAKYKTGDFNHAAFWDWCKRLANEGHVVFVSEYSGPDFAKVVWEKEVTSGLRKNSKRAEKLYLVERSA